MEGPSQSTRLGSAGQRSAVVHRFQPLVVVVTALSTGIIADHFGELGHFFPRSEIFAIALWWLIVVSAWAVWLVLWKRRWNGLAALALLLSVAAIGGAWHHVRWSLFSPVEIARYAASEAQPVCIRGVALESPDLLPAPPRDPLRAIPQQESSRLLIRAQEIRDGTAWRPVGGVCGLRVDGSLSDVHAGDEFQIFAQCQEYGLPSNPGEFDFTSSARAERRLCSLFSESPECLERLARGNWFSVRGMLEGCREWLKRQLEGRFQPERGPVAAMILLGIREGLPAEEFESYFLTGTIHVLVVSGMHVAILAGGLYAALRLGWLSRRVGLIAVVTLIITYALITGAEPSIVRATVVVITVCLAAWSGRTIISWNALAAAGLVVLALNPADLFRTGPQLSFLAVGALILCGSWDSFFPFRRNDDPLARLIAETRSWFHKLLLAIGRWTGRLLLTSAVVWFVTLPLVMYQFHVVTPVAILISPVVWLLATAILYSGFGILAFAPVAPWIAAFFGAICDRSLAGLGWLVEVSRSVPLAYFWTPGPALWWVLGFYLGLAGVLIGGRRWISPRWQVGLVCLWIAIGFLPPILRATGRDELRCAFLDVGHGTCIVLETPDGHTLLYDAGSLGSPDYVSRTIASYLWHRGITSIDAVILSHADVDHYNGVPGLLKRFPIGAAYVSPLMFAGLNPEKSGPVVLQESLDESRVPIREVWAGDRLRLGDVTIQILHPPELGVLGSDNANSVTALVEYQGRRILLPGDLETPGLELLMSELPMDCDMVLAPHHGSRRSDPPGFAAWSSPEWVVVSGRNSEDTESVIATYRESGARVLHTAVSGAIEFEFGKNGPNVAISQDR